MKLPYIVAIIMLLAMQQVIATDHAYHSHRLYDLDKATEKVLTFIKENPVADMIEHIEPEEMESLLKNYSPAQMVFQAEVHDATLPAVALFYEKGEPFSEQAVSVLEDLSLEFEGTLKFVKINSRSLFTIAEQENIQQLPTIIIFYHKNEIERYEGLYDREMLRNHLTNFIDTLLIAQQEN